MESKYNYFKRDISWLSFNYRVLLEATDEHLPLYERINFISIYSSNLEEFYKIRVADHKAVASGATESDEETVQSARELVEEINREVTRQLDDRVHIYEQKILPALRRNHIIFYQDRHVEPFHQQFIKDFFREESRKRRYFSYIVIGCELRASFNNLLYIVRAHSNKADTLHKRRSIHSAYIHRSSAACLSCYPEIAQPFDSVHSDSRFLCGYKKFESAVLTSEINRVLFTVLTLFKTQYNSTVLIFGYADFIHINTSL